MMRKISRVLIFAVIIALLLFSILPFILMIIAAIQHTQVLDFNIEWSAVTLENFYNLFVFNNFGAALGRSAAVVLIACTLKIIVSTLAAYGFVFKPFPGSEILFWIYLATMMVPSQVTMISMFVIFRKIDLLGTTLGLALPIVNAFGVFLVRQFMQGIPKDLLEAAKIDGASDLRIFFSIILPLSTPVITALTVFTFLTTWNDFMWPLVSLSNGASTVTLAVSQLSGEFQTEYGMVMAGTTIAFMVPFLAYVILQRRFVEGIASSGIKG